MQNFRTFTLAVEFYRLASALRLKNHLKDQLARAASSIALNLAEGQGKIGNKDRARFFQIAFGSVRECQAILILSNLQNSIEWKKLDSVAAHLYRLLQNVGG